MARLGGRGGAERFHFLVRFVQHAILLFLSFLLRDSGASLPELFCPQGNGRPLGFGEADR